MNCDIFPLEVRGIEGVTDRIDGLESNAPFIVPCLRHLLLVEVRGTEGVMR